MLILWAIELRVAASTASLCFRTFSVKETTKLKFISKEILSTSWDVNHNICELLSRISATRNRPPHYKNL